MHSCGWRYLKEKKKIHNFFCKYTDIIRVFVYYGHVMSCNTCADVCTLCYKNQYIHIFLLCCVFFHRLLHCVTKLCILVPIKWVISTLVSATIKFLRTEAWTLNNHFFGKWFLKILLFKWKSRNYCSIWKLQPLVRYYFEQNVADEMLCDVDWCRQMKKKYLFCLFNLKFHE